MSEAKTYQKLKDHVIRYPDRIDRIENLMVAGMPDCNLCIKGVESWIELKNPIEPVRKNTKLFGSNHKVLISQSNWMKRQTDAGGRAFLFVETQKRYMLVNGQMAKYMNDWTTGDCIFNSIWNLTKKEKNQNWEDLRGILSNAIQN